MISHKVQPSFPSSFFRREAIARIGTLVCGYYLFGVTVGVIAADTLYPTPAQIEGPFYPKIMPAEADWNLLKVGLNSFLIGEPLKLYGKVFDLFPKKYRENSKTKFQYGNIHRETLVYT